MDPGAAKVIRALTDAGYKAYAVGGCVRDSMLGKTPHDWDICSSATPEQVLEVFAPERCILTGLKHGTITIKQDGGLYEVTTFRTEGTYTDGRHPDAVAYVARVEEDLARRDFTMNAMAYNEDEGLVDPFGGAEDLLVHRMVRAVGVPKERFGEDALRIMRLFRFAAREGLNVDPETLEAALVLRENLRRISAERIREELLGLLAAGKPGRWLLPEVLTIILPEAMPADACGTERLQKLIDAAPAVREVRLAALLSAAEDVQQVMRRLKFDNKTTAAVSGLVQLQALLPEREAHALRIQARRLIGRSGMERIGQLRDLRAAQRAVGDALPALDGLAETADEVVRQGLCCRLNEMAVGGEDLREELGVMPGPALGALLSKLLERVLTDVTPNEREALLTAARGMMEETR